MKANTIVQVYFREEEILKNLIEGKPFSDVNTIKGDIRLLDKEISKESLDLIYIEYREKLNQVRLEIDNFINAL